MSQQNLAKHQLPKPPNVDDLAPHRSLTGIRRLAAMATIKRVPQFAGLALVGLGLYAGATTLADRGHVPNDERKIAMLPAASQEDVTPIAPELPTLAVPVTVVKTVPLSADAKPKEEIPAPATAPKAETPASANIPDGALPEVPGVADDMGKVDIGDIAAAVDTLGIRADNLESTLKETKPAAAVDPAVHAAPTDAAAPKAPEMSSEDAKVHSHLEARLKEFEAKGDKAGIKAAKGELEMFEATLSTLIEFRIVDRKGEKPGFWRTLVDDPKTKQFFVVVEASVEGEPVNWAVRDADSGKIVSGAKFALKVDEKTFAELSADKKDDGRIANMVVGLKPVGRITPVWSIKTDGETITEF